MVHERNAASPPFIWARLASFLSIAPLGLWTVNHLWNNLAAFRGAEAWEQSVTQYAHPIAEWTTLTIVLLPLLIHTVWGIQRLFSFRPNNITYPTYENFKFLLQRLSAIGVLFFLGAHLWLAMIQPRLVEGRPEPFSEIAREMRFHTPTLLVYLLGTLAVCYHLANGIFGFSWTRGIAAGRRSFSRMNALATIAFVLLMVVSWAAIYALWSAGGRYEVATRH
jgi:succinate dehydrogenase / fumarate reductase cytochrome b subunit